MTYIISNIFRNTRPGDPGRFGPDRMADAFAYRAPYSVCEEMGTGHSNYVGSLFVRRPRARFTSRESKITLTVYVYPGSPGIRRADLLARFTTPERGISAVNLWSFDSFPFSPFRAMFAQSASRFDQQTK